jgi:protein-S-isoprenylcysteine O-methyltransferase Ste14
MQASRFEFERRFWIIAGIYVVGFSIASSDHARLLNQLQLWLAPAANRSSFARVILAIGTLLVFVAAAIRTWGAAYLKSDIVHDTRQHSEALVADGPFRYTRNPLYFANLPMAVGIGLLASTWGFVFLVLANWIFVYRLIYREEASLRETQGASYQAYLKTVPRFWPSLTPRVPSGGASPRWPQAFFGETFIWLFGLAELCLAITLNAKIGLTVFALGFVAHFFTNRALLRRS